MLDVRKLLLCKYVCYYVNVRTCKDVKGFLVNCGAAHQKTEAFQMIFNAADQGQMVHVSGAGLPQP